MKSFVYLVGCLMLLTGCVETPDEEVQAPAPEEHVEVDDSLEAPSAPDDEQPSLVFDTIDDEIRYYIGKLPDTTFTSVYGGDEHPKIWYTSAEELGRIGKPAIPYLVERLESGDPYEVKLAVYALMLASQDAALKEETNGEYINLGEVLTESGNAENKEVALAWWSKYKHLFG